MTMRTPVASETGGRVCHSQWNIQDTSTPRKPRRCDTSPGVAALSRRSSGANRASCSEARISFSSSFDEYIALLIFKGALLQENGKILARVGEQMQAPRQLRFRSLADITRQKSTSEALIEQPSSSKGREQRLSQTMFRSLICLKNCSQGSLRNPP